jgi:hypothetical protein
MTNARRASGALASGRIQAVDFHFLAAGAGDQDADDFVALLHNFD